MARFKAKQHFYSYKTFLPQNKHVDNDWYKNDESNAAFFSNLKITQLKTMAEMDYGWIVLWPKCSMAEMTSKHYSNRDCSTSEKRHCISSDTESQKGLFFVMSSVIDLWLGLVGKYSIIYPETFFLNQHNFFTF